MKQRITLLALLLACASLSALAGNIKGKLLDKAQRTALEFANVTLYAPGGDTPVKGTVTDLDGEFLLADVANGTYDIQFAFLGYSPLRKTIVMHGQDIVMGKIYLEEDSHVLQEVEVVGQGSTMRFELDKKVFSVDQNIAAAGASVSEALENIPSVEVDQEGNVSLRNSEAVEIWINGKPSGLTAENRAQILQQMPAESIKEIELITNPSAKYSPEGTAGVINLVMKKDRKAGYFGSVQAGLDYALAAPWNLPPGANVGLNLNMNKGICDAYVNAGYRFHTGNGGNTSHRYGLTGVGSGSFNPETDDYLTHLYQKSNNDRRDHGLFLRAGFDLRLSEHSSWGVSGFGMVSDPNAFRGTGMVDNQYLLTDAMGTTLRDYHRLQNNRSWHPGGNVRTDYIFNYNKHNLHLSGAFNYFTWNQQNAYTQVEMGDTLSQWQQNGNADPFMEVKADYEWKPTKSSRLEAGYQMNMAWRSTTADAGMGAPIVNEHGHYTTDQPLYAYWNDFLNREQTHALYLTYGNRFFEKLSVQVGLRGEFFQRHIESDSYDEAGARQTVGNDTTYFQLYPSAYISYDFGHGHELQVNYTRRVDRPRGHQIDPRNDFSDSTNIRYGNPYLLPAYSNSFELNYLKQWERHTLSAGLFWRMQENIIQNVKFMDDNVMKNTFSNLGVRHELGAEVVGKNRLFGDLLQLTTSANLYWNTISESEYRRGDIYVLLPAHQALSWSVRMNASFLFTKTFTGQLSANYRSPRVLAQGQTTHSYSIDLGLRKTFLDRKLALAFNVRDILDSRSRRSITWGEGFYLQQQMRWHSRSVSLTLTYNFGNMKQNKKPNMDSSQQSMMGGEEMEMMSE